MWRHLLTLLEQPAPVDDVRAAMVARRRRATFRTAGVHALRALLGGSKLRSTQREILVQLTPALLGSARRGARGIAPALFDGLETCGTDLHAAAREAFSQLYTHLISMLKSEDVTAAPLLLAIMQALSLKYSASDYK